MLKYSVLILSMLLLFSCGKSAEEKTASAVLSANISLSKGRCQDAINVLEEIGRQNSNARYLKTLASAYACRSNFSAVTFLASDIGNTATPAPLGGSTIYTTSLVTVTSPLTSDSKFRDLQTAINILLYAGGIPSSAEPTATERAKYFSADEAADINSQLLFMMFAQLGKYMHVYGNGDALGKKGAGAGTNKCFTGYNRAWATGPAGVQAVITALPAQCRSPGAESPHSELAFGVAATLRKARLCSGVVLLNGILNVLPSVVASASGQLATQGSAVSVAAGAASAALNLADPTIGVVASTINQEICEDNASVPVDKLETYFAFMFESSFQP